MEKPAPTQYPIHSLLKRRWSPHAFHARPVEPSVLRTLFEAARWAPSSNNEQPWRFIVATKDNPEEFDRMLQCLVEGNRVWAKTAPVLIITVASMTFARNGKPNHHAFHDVGQAMADLTVQATDEGLFVHQMAGFDAEKARQTYDIPAGFEPVAAAALGYPGDIDALPPNLKERTLGARARHPQEQFVFKGKFGQSL